jgi:hypothetical protein
VEDGCLERRFPQAPKLAFGKHCKAKALAKWASNPAVRTEGIESPSATATQKGTVGMRHHPKTASSSSTKVRG